MVTIRQRPSTSQLNSNGWKRIAKCSKNFEFFEEGSPEGKHDDMAYYKVVISAFKNPSPIKKCMALVTEIFDRVKHAPEAGVYKNTSTAWGEYKSSAKDQSKILIRHKALKGRNQRLNVSALRATESEDARTRVITEVEEVEEYEAVVTFSHPLIGWHSMVVSTARFDFPLKRGMLVPIDVWFDGRKGITQYRIPARVALKDIAFAQSLDEELRFIEEPNDYNDQVQLDDYARRLSVYFSNDQ